MEDYKFYNMVQILDFLGIKYNFENNEGKQYPFKDKPSDIIFNYGYITIPREGIEKIIQNKISDKDYHGILKEIKMLVHIPFYCKRTQNTGTIIVNVTVGFRYDKEYKYGDVKNHYQNYVMQVVTSPQIKIDDNFKEIRDDEMF